ncbi:MAG TPA: GNAT family N-acetyltransferase [Solirubrobacterales bacterium]|nr:GNAT family N-acetyltransferase [Solirubrobacterales bacterium]
MASMDSPTGPALTARIVEATGELAELRREWDALAVHAGRPFAAPAWALGWWETMRPDAAELRLVVVLEGGGLAGIVPLYRLKRAYLPLGGGMGPVEPLARPGLERRVAEAARAALAQEQPRPATVEVEMHGSSPDWAALLGDAWAGGRGARRWTKRDTPVPRIDLGEGFEPWLEAKSARFRREMRRRRRKLEDAGGTFRLATADSLQRDVEAFLRLHRRRREGQGGTSLGDEGVERMLVAVGEELLDSGRFRLLSIDLDGETIAARLLLAAGREVSAWNSGFDEAHSKLSPSTLSILEALRDASERGERTMSLGPGGQEYKYRLSNWEDSLYTHVLILPGATYPLARLRQVPAQLRVGLSARLSAETKRRLRGLIRR